MKITHVATVRSEAAANYLLAAGWTLLGVSAKDGGFAYCLGAKSLSRVNESAHGVQMDKEKLGDVTARLLNLRREVQELNGLLAAFLRPREGETVGFGEAVIFDPARLQETFQSVFQGGRVKGRIVIHIGTRSGSENRFPAEKDVRE